MRKHKLRGGKKTTRRATGTRVEAGKQRSFSTLIGLNDSARHPMGVAATDAQIYTGLFTNFVCNDVDNHWIRMLSACRANRKRGCYGLMQRRAVPTQSPLQPGQ